MMSILQKVRPLVQMFSLKCHRRCRRAMPIFVSPAPE